VTFSTPTADTGLILSTLAEQFAELYSPHQQYHRAGVFLYDFAPAQQLQTDLLGYVKPSLFDRSSARMHAMDSINNRWGKYTIRIAAENLAQQWQPKHRLRSPRYVSHWQELPQAVIRTPG
jgi:DNA polymerase V